MTTEVRPISDDRSQLEEPRNRLILSPSQPDPEAKILMASQWTLMWRKFRKHGWPCSVA